MNGILIKIRRSFLPPRPGPAHSRRVAEARLMVCGLFAFAIFATIAVRVTHLADANASTRIAANGKADLAERGRILDRNGRMMAGNLPVTVLHADPREIMNIAEAAESLAPLLAHHDVKSLTKLLSKKTRYVELDRQLTPKNHARILQLGIPGVYFADGLIRVYPRDHAAAHILGHVDTDNHGIAGIEKSMNSRLAAGDTVTLSIDLGVQEVMRREIYRQMQSFEAIGGAGVFLDIKTGEALAMVSLPDYNPNQFALASQEARFNRATKGLYEMGSSFKVLNTAIALETGAANTMQRFEVKKPLRVARFTIRDYHPRKRALNVPEILVYSSNIGSALMAEAIGAKLQRAYMDKLGLLSRLDLEIPETSRPLSPAIWRRATTVTVSYGHGISVSPAHLASAIAAASGNGQWIQPTLLKRQVGDEPLRLRVFSEETAKAVRSMMRLVVSHPRGSGKKANAPGYMVGGKTGTAEKNKAGSYDKKVNFVNFVATFPVHDPRYVIAIMVDEPKGQKHSFGYSTAGWVAAPAVQRVVEQVAPMLGVLPVDEESPLIRQKLMLDFQVSKEEATRASY